MLGFAEDMCAGGAAAEVMWHRRGWTTGSCAGVDRSAKHRATACWATGLEAGPNSRLTMAVPIPRLAAAAPSDIETLEHSFQRSGWCVHQFRRLRRTCEPGTLRYLSTLDRRGYRPNDHSACKDRPCCIANNVTNETYITRHTQTCSGSCALVGVDYNQIVNIIRAGGVPIVSVHVDDASTSDDAIVHLSVTPRTISTRYTVISHVWSDGLGNPFANALPTCQLQRLYVQLRSLPPDHESGVVSLGSLQVDWTRQSFVRHPSRRSPMFWMDTLCIPVHPEHGHLRDRAITQMASIYAAAVQELVLDAELMQCEVVSRPALESLARVACSAWMTRSWTLQEGVLARECVFQFGDCAIDPIHEWCLQGPRPAKTSIALPAGFPHLADIEQWAVYKELYDRLWDTLHQDWKSTYRKDPPPSAAYQASDGIRLDLGGLRAGRAAGKILTLPAAQGLSKRGRDGLDELDHFTMQPGQHHRIKQLVDTWNELAHRSTTKPQDLHVIIANLLDFNADSIMNIPTSEERMRAMLLSFDSLPVSLFWNTGPKWCGGRGMGNDKHNQWIPIEPSKSELTATPVMNVTAEWLTLDLGSGNLQDRSGVQVYLLQANGIDILEQSNLLCSAPSQVVYNITLFHARNEEDKPASSRIEGEGPYYLLTEEPTTGTACSIRGALFRGLPAQTSDEGHVLRLSYYCPVALHTIERTLSPSERRASCKVLTSKVHVKIKYGESSPAFGLMCKPLSNSSRTKANCPLQDPIPHFTRHLRRLNRGPSLQGGVAIMVFLPIPVFIGVICMVGFIVILARPPHTLTPTAEGLLAAFVILYVACPLLGAGWLFFVEAFMYRMWLESFEKDWVARGDSSWWGRYVRLERRLGRAEHAVYTYVKKRILPSLLALRSSADSGRHDEVTPLGDRLDDREPCRER
jgi:hypothetical protein